MLMFLLAAALVLLVAPGPAAAAPHPNLKRIIDLVGKYNDSLNKEFFVEDVQPLYEAGCGDKFFCKVQEVLLKHETVTKRKDEHELLRNLQVFTKHLSPMSCEQLLKDVQPTQPKVEIQIPKVIELLSNCIQRKNWNGDER